MTVVPDDNLMTLICDVCGETTTGTACVLPDAEVVWTLVSDHGWSGSPFATGPHRCPRCSAMPAGTTAQGTDRPRIEEVPVIATGGDVEPGTEDTVRTALRTAVDVDGTVVVNLLEVQVIDSAGLGLLVRAHRDVRDRGGQLFLAAPSRFVRTVLHTMKLDGVFPIFDSLDTAMAYLRTEAQPSPPATPPTATPTLPAKRRTAGRVKV
ncbi:STAS domain-containing protein [Micromonospora sp. LOL_024]|uniref:STAS domain-containing protein n=1 Tax=Micromonospora sp. LOL_024 TaxID=3345412 RepID=UPI003A89EB61